jgi:hypothetical protein
MKKNYILRFAYSVLMALGTMLLLPSNHLHAQAWTIAICSGGPPSVTIASTYGPMYSTATANSTNRTATIYPASQLSGIANTILTNIYFHKATAATMGGSPNFKVYLKEVSAVDWGTANLNWATAITGATLVYDGNPITILGSTTGWKNFPFTTNFPYSGTQNLAVFMEYKNTAASTAISWSYEYTGACVNTGNNNTTKYLNNTTGTLPADLTTSNYRRPYIGFDTYVTPCNTPGVTFPASATTSVSPTTLCVSGNVTLNMTPVTPMPAAGGITYQWQSGPTATGPWTNIGAAPTTTPTFTTTTPITANSYFRCQVLCNGATTTLTSSASVQVVVNNPGTPTVTGASRCGPGTVNLSATPPAGSTINWYQNPTGGAPIGTGNTFSTGYLPSTTTFYAAAASGSSPAAGWIGTGTTASANPSPIYTLYHAQKSQFIIPASEMIAAGFGAGTINSMGIDVVANAGLPINNFEIRMGTTALNAITALQPTPALQVYSAALYNPVANSVNTFTFTTPFVWDGTSNILIETCFNNTTWSSGHTVKTTATSYTSSYVCYADVSGFCAAPSTTLQGTYSSRPNFHFNMTLGCNGPRVPVVATINSSPVVARTAPPVVCNDAVAPIVLTPPSPAYPNYTWTPTTNLYTNAAGTTPYTGGSATTLYMRTTDVGQQTYYMMAGNPNITTGCTYADTVRIWVQPGDIAIKGLPDTLCAPGGSSTLKLDPLTGYYPGTIKWQQSTNGTTYTDITGANTSTYVTPNLNFGQNTYFKSIISAGSQTCEQPVKYMVIANPTVLNTFDSFNCGPGTVTLRAITGGNGTARWYDVPTLGLPLGTGGEFTTPFLASTDTFYVESAAGGSSAPPTFVGNGTSVTNDYRMPYYDYYYGSKVQYLVRASELIAAGFGPGNITEIAFDVTSVASSFPQNNFYISIKSTTATALTTTWETGMTPVFSVPAYYPVANSINAHTFSAPFSWDGESNLILEVCHNNSNYNTSGASTNVRYATYGYNATHYVYADVTTVCSAPGTGSVTTTRPNIRFTISGGCKSPREPVVAFIHPFPTVDLGPDINKCIDEGGLEVLDAGVQQHNPTFLWDNGATSQVRAVGSSGSYSVKVTNQYGCMDSDTVQVTMRANPVVELGNDTSVCNGVTLNIDAGDDGIEYFWNTGQTAQQININTPGTYSVFVTNAAGCVKSDTIKINMDGELPAIAGIQVTNNGINSFQFTAINPTPSVIGYEWNFGDNSNPSYQPSPVHVYNTAGYYTVTLKLSSTCGFAYDSSAANIVSIDQLNIDKNELSIYPNPTRTHATILNKGSLRMENIEVYNVLGQLVYQAKADNDSSHALDVQGLASGIYTVQIYTDKGSVARKLEVIQ